MCKELREVMRGYVVGEIFSQSKNELILSLYNSDLEFFIKAHLSPQFCCLSFPKRFSRAKKNSVDLFSAIIDTKIHNVVQIENDRSFYFELSNNYKLLFKMHGNRSNIVLMQHDGVVEIFRKNLNKDLKIKIDDLKKEVSINFQAFKLHDGNYKKLIPTFGNAFEEYFEINGYHQLKIEDQYTKLNSFLSYLESPNYFIHTSVCDLPKLNLYYIDKKDEAFNSPIDAVNAFFTNYISKYNTDKEKQKIINRIHHQLARIDSYLSKTKAKQKKLLTSKNYKYLGDLIMANLHLIAPHATEVALADFYDQKPVKVQLKSNLTPPLNAEKYYQKAKKQQLEVDALRNNIDLKEGERKKLLNELESIDSLTSFKALSRKNRKNESQPLLPFNKVTFMGYEILIGKNAVKNEQLTFETANKDDLFLHSKNSSGSHVILRKKDNQNFPKPVIEKAASLAAFYSKSKNEALCSVLYTYKKYVRKVKGAPPGRVIVKNEQVILVKPVGIRN